MLDFNAAGCLARVLILHIYLGPLSNRRHHIADAPGHVIFATLLVHGGDRVVHLESWLSLLLDEQLHLAKTAVCETLVRSAWWWCHLLLFVCQVKCRRVIRLVQTYVIPFHAEQFFGLVILCLLLLGLFRAEILIHAPVDSAIFTYVVITFRFFGTWEAVDVSLANSDFFLAVVDHVDLILCSSVQLSDLTNHDLQLKDTVLGHFVFLSDFIDLILDLFFFRESSELLVNALDVELTA